MIKKIYLPPQVSDASQILHLKLWEGTLFDYSNNNHPGTLNGTLPTYQFPGVDFPGTDEYISVEDAAAFTPANIAGGTPLSISAWVNMDDATDFMIAVKGVYNTDGEWQFHVNDSDQLSFMIYDESVDNCYIKRRSNATTLTAYQGKWVHVAGTYDGGTTYTGMAVYLNGVDIGDAGNNLGVFAVAEDLAGKVRIGEYDGSYADGRIDDVRIFTTEQTAVQVRNLYELTRWRYGV